MPGVSTEDRWKDINDRLASYEAGFLSVPDATMALAAKEPSEFRERVEKSVAEYLAAKHGAEGIHWVDAIKEEEMLDEDAVGEVTFANVQGAIASVDPAWAPEPYKERTEFIRALTRELFLERAKASPSGKISPDYAKLAYEGAVSVADILGLED